MVIFVIAVDYIWTIPKTIPVVVRTFVVAPIVLVETVYIMNGGIARRVEADLLSVIDEVITANCVVGIQKIKGTTTVSYRVIGYEVSACIKLNTTSLYDIIANNES